MANQFDIVDIVYDAVEPVSTSFILYKDRSGDGETKNHITIRMLTLNETEVVNKGSVNINVFVKNQAKGRPDRPRRPHPHPWTVHRGGEAVPHPGRGPGPGEKHRFCGPWA